MLDGGTPRYSAPVVSRAHPDPARRRIMRSMAVWVPMVVPAVMGVVVLLILR